MRRVLLSFALVLVSVALAYAQNYIDMCFNYLNAGDYQRSIEAGKLAVKQYPNNTDAYFCLGKAYTETGQLNLAIDSFKKAEMYARTDKDLMYIYNWLGINYQEKEI